jgi:hypothetical protein
LRSGTASASPNERWRPSSAASRCRRDRRVEEYADERQRIGEDQREQRELAAVDALVCERAGQHEDQRQSDPAGEHRDRREREQRAIAADNLPRSARQAPGARKAPFARRLDDTALHL